MIGHDDGLHYLLRHERTGLMRGYSQGGLVWGYENGGDVESNENIGDQSFGELPTGLAAHLGAPLGQTLGVVPSLSALPTRWMNRTNTTPRFTTPNPLKQLMAIGGR